MPCDFEYSVENARGREVSFQVRNWASTYFFKVNAKTKPKEFALSMNRGLTLLSEIEKYETECDNLRLLMKTLLLGVVLVLKTLDLLLQTNPIERQVKK